MGLLIQNRLLVQNILASSKRNIPFLISLVALFVASFAVPVLLGIKAKGFFSFSHTPAIVGDSLFPRAIGIRGAGSYIKIPSTDNLNPQVGKDFLVSIWLKPRSIPEPKERQIFLLKYDGEK